MQDKDQYEYYSASNCSADRHAQASARYSPCAAKTINRRAAVKGCCCCCIHRCWRPTYFVRNIQGHRCCQMVHEPCFTPPGYRRHWTEIERRTGLRIIRARESVITSTGRWSTNHIMRNCQIDRPNDQNQQGQCDCLSPRSFPPVVRRCDIAAPWSMIRRYPTASY